MKVAMYVRVSTYRQALTQTIEQQIQLLSEHSQTHGWPWCEDHLFGMMGSVERVCVGLDWIDCVTRFAVEPLIAS